MIMYVKEMSPHEWVVAIYRDDGEEQPVIFRGKYAKRRAYDYKDIIEAADGLGGKLAEPYQVLDGSN